MTVLGPCRCQGCGRMVIWDGWVWTERSRKHFCTPDHPAKRAHVSKADVR